MANTELMSVRDLSVSTSPAKGFSTHKRFVLGGEEFGIGESSSR